LITIVKLHLHDFLSPRRGSGERIEERGAL